MAEILAALQNRNLSQTVRSEDSQDVKHECSKCLDKGVIIFRVHKDTEWQGFTPKEKVLEEDFLSGSVCSPDRAKEWLTTFSQRCSCIAEKRTERLMKASEITEEFKRLGFQNFVREGKPKIIQDIYEAALEYYQDFKEIRNVRANSIALLGQPGTGKTHLLTAISNNLLQRQQVPVLYFPYVEGCNNLKDDFSKLEAKLERMKQVDILFIDDLFKPVKGNPRATDWQVEQMYAVINYRYLNHKPILVSSELTVDELVEVDEALGTRIYEMCQDFTVVIQGDRKELNHRLEALKHV
ncbi:ATP-binding protein [Jeotgalibacillus soli]